MRLTFEGTLKMVQKGKEFTDKETGEVRPAKYTNYFQTEKEDGSPDVVQVRSKTDYSALIDAEVVGTIELYAMSEGSGFWASLVECKDVRQSDTIQA